MGGADWYGQSSPLLVLEGLVSLDEPYLCFFVCLSCFILSQACSWSDFLRGVLGRLADGE